MSDMTGLRSSNDRRQYEQKSSRYAGDGIIETLGVYSRKNYCTEVWSEL